MHAEQWIAVPRWHGFVAVDEADRIVCWGSGHPRLHLTREGGELHLRRGERLAPVELDASHICAKAAA